jgi:hypothetical protein
MFSCMTVGMMTQKLQSHSIPIALAMTFFMVGFFLVSNGLGLTEREIALGLIAGATGGLSVLVAVLWSDRKLVVPASRHA